MTAESGATAAGDAAILYCFVFLHIVFAGAGPVSIDRLRGAGRRTRSEA